MEFSYILQLAGGLGLFLYGMKMMSDGFERVAGDKLRQLLEFLTKKRFIAMLVGALFTMIIQSSSATTVMIVGFVNAGLMNLFQAAPVIMGANLGTTITAQIIALNVTEYAPIVLIFGIVMSMIKRKRISKWAEPIIGFGILFIGLGFMGDALKPLGEIEGFRNIMTSFSHPLLGIAAGALFTGVVQSSSASIGILQALAGEGLIGLGGATYVLMGQNIGTCITALLSSINTNKTARRAAIIHLLFNVLGAAVFYVIISVLPMAKWIETLFPGNPMQQIAIMHIAFNVIGIIVFLPLTNLLVKLAELIVPGKDKEFRPLRTSYIDKRLLSTPPAALNACVKEIQRMGSIAYTNLECAVNAFIARDETKVADIQSEEKAINFLEHEITEYLVSLNQLELPKNDLELIASFFHVVNDLERIGDHATNIGEYITAMVDGNIEMSSESMREARLMYDEVSKLFDLAMKIFSQRDKSLVSDVAPIENRVDELEKTLREKHIERLTNNVCNVRSGMIFTDLASNLERVADHATNIAYSVK